ncbi:MAG: CPBP family intramembrane metalloprotease [Planctomycetaceae bacterium]|nr:CPBP family intramembrane metalloprotease [Planctomycetaceae bacterium]
MKWRNIRLIFTRELRDQLRDRRTLFMILILPMLLYPVLGIGMVQLTLLFSEQPRTVVILGAEDLPAPALIDQGRFVASWFRIPDNADKLKVISDSDVKNEANPDPKQVEILAGAEAIREKLEQKQSLEGEYRSAVGRKDEAKLNELKPKIATLQSELSGMFSESHAQVLVIIPRKFRDNLNRVNELLSKGLKSELVEDYPRPIVVHNDADEKSLIAYGRVKEALDSWEQAILNERLKQAQLPTTLPNPIHPIGENLASGVEIASNMWSKLFPTLLVLMSITGAFYPAIDLCAGEKERGTMETLLICPAARSEIVLGKFLTVLCFSICTAMLNLASMGMTSSHIMNMTGRLGHDITISPPGIGAIFTTMILLVPLAALFSALCLSLATFARSSKEGQYYLTPLLMVTLGLTMYCLSPGVEITPFYSIMPVVGVALLLKGLLLHPMASSGLYVYAIPVLLTTFCYSMLALWWAIDQFRREDVLFREAERFELKLWLRHLLRDKEPLPSFAEAVVCFLLIMFLQFSFLSLGSSGDINDLPYLIMVQQLAMIGCPSVFMALILTTNFRKTMRLNFADLTSFGLVTVLAAALHPVSLALAGSLSWFFPKLPENVTRFMEQMHDPSQPWWIPIVTLALAPAVCEELAFRGFILSGFSRSGRVGLGIVMSSLTFGVMHMIPMQVFNAALLGLVLGFIAIKTNSLLPGIWFHFLYNSMAIIHGKLSTFAKEGGIKDHHLYTVTEKGIEYNAVTVAISLITAAVILHYFWRRKRPDADAATLPDPSFPKIASVPRLS